MYCPPAKFDDTYRGFRFKVLTYMGGPKKRNPSFNFAITSVNVHGF